MFVLIAPLLLLAQQVADKPDKFDPGQLIIALAITVSAWFIKKEITTIGARLTKNEEVITKVVGDMQRLIGNMEVLMERRSSVRKGHE